MPSLALAMIIYNAARTLRQCLDSVQELVQEIRIIDTGSQDQSLAIAKQFGAQVASFEWCEDFSAARNASIEGLQSDWILILDADEFLPPNSRAYLRHVLCELSHSQDPLILNGTQETPGRPGLSKRCLFRNHQGLHFVGRVHEQLKGSRPATLEIPELVIAHQPTDNSEKAYSYLRLIKLELEENTEPLRQAELYYHQAKSYQEVAKPLLAMAAFQDAYRILSPIARLKKSHGHDFYLQVQLQLLFAYLNCNQMTAAYSLAQAFQVSAPERPEAWFYQAYTAFWLNQDLNYTLLIQAARERCFPDLDCDLLGVRCELRSGKLEQAGQHLQSLPADHYHVRLLSLYLYLRSHQYKQASVLWQDIALSELSSEQLLRLAYWSPQERLELRKALTRSEMDTIGHNSEF